jgi:hypothetical protein
MNELGVERLCVFGMPPVEFVKLAADVGCSCVGINLIPTRFTMTLRPNHPACRPADRWRAVPSLWRDTKTKTFPS